VDPLTAFTGALWGLSAAMRRAPVLASPDRTIELVVAQRRIVARDEDVVALKLVAADGKPLHRWHPGAHIDIHLPSGRVRQYSLCGDPDAGDSYRIAVRRIPGGGGGSTEVHDAVRVGTRVTTNGPRNAFPLTIPDHGRLRFIAGGIGITPILPMLRLAESVGADWSIVYAGRSVESMPFLDEVRCFGERVEVLAGGMGGAAQLVGDCEDGTAVYACGPPPMLTAIRQRLAGRHRVELHFERFAAPPVVDGEEFTVCVGSRAVHVGAEETLLSALQRAGIAAPYSCQQGFCGTCRTRVLGVLEGIVDHRDTLLTEPERRDGMMLVCVSRAHRGERLVLDL
jgi:ferredoxin-NADP reductase